MSTAYEIFHFYVFFLSSFSFSQEIRNVIGEISEHEDFGRHKPSIIGRWDEKNKTYYYIPTHYRKHVENSKPRSFKIKTDLNNLQTLQYCNVKDRHYFTFGKSNLKQEVILFHWNTSYVQDSNIYVDRYYPDDKFRITNSFMTLCILFTQNDFLVFFFR